MKLQQRRARARAIQSILYLQFSTTISFDLPGTSGAHGVRTRPIGHGKVQRPLILMLGCALDGPSYGVQREAKADSRGSDASKTTHRMCASRPARGFVSLLHHLRIITLSLRHTR